MVRSHTKARGLLDSIRGPLPPRTPRCQEVHHLPATPHCSCSQDGGAADSIGGQRFYLLSCSGPEMLSSY